MGCLCRAWGGYHEGRIDIEEDPHGGQDFLYETVRAPPSQLIAPRWRLSKIRGIRADRSRYNKADHPIAFHKGDMFAASKRKIADAGPVADNEEVFEVSLCVL